jgi:hypothetical protein
MKTWERWLGAGKKLLARVGDGRKPAGGSQTVSSVPAGAADDKSGLSGWVENRAQRVVENAYASHAQDLEQRAMRVMTSVYEKSADDLEERATRALRRAIEAEAGHIKDAIEHGIAVKKREVRLSLLVLVVSSLVYLALYWFTRRPDAP